MSRGAIQDAQVLELYCGTAAFSVEMLSRGAARAVAVDRDKRLLHDVQRFCDHLELPLRTVCFDLRRGELRVPGSPFEATLLFADPPYDEAEGLCDVLSRCLNAGVLRDNAWVVVESRDRDRISFHSVMRVEASYRYGMARMDLGRLRTEVVASSGSVAGGVS